MELRIPTDRCRSRRRTGVILVFSTILMIIMMIFMGLSLDVGYIQNAQTELDRAVDASALAGAGALPEGTNAADITALYYMRRNLVGNRPLAESEMTVEAGHWDRVSRTFTPHTEVPSALRVMARLEDQRPLLFARLFGPNHFALTASAVAVCQPRDIMLVLDYSASMNDDSEFKAIPTLGRETVEDNLLRIYEELGSPAFGTLRWEPQWMTVPGAEPTIGDEPKIHVQHRYHEVYVTSTKPFSRVEVYHQRDRTTSHSQGTWNPEMQAYEQLLTYNDISRVTKVNVRSGYTNTDHSDANHYEEQFLFSTPGEVQSAAKRAWRLTRLDYPYPSGSWSEYIDYCTSSSSQNQNKRAGYLYKFGYLNYVNFLLDKKPRHSQTPVLWRTSEQPITAVKNAVETFLGLMRTTKVSDRVGLAIYSSDDGWGKLEHGLTRDYHALSKLSFQRQAGHYHDMANIAGGMDRARDELQQRARADARRIIVLMTDGEPTYPNSTSYARGLALRSAEACAAARLPVITISLGARADVALMEQIADITGGASFRVPGDRPLQEVEAELREIFRRLAQERPLKLVQVGRGK